MIVDFDSVQELHAFKHSYKHMYMSMSLPHYRKADEEKVLFAKCFSY